MNRRSIRIAVLFSAFICMVAACSIATPRSPAQQPPSPTGQPQAAQPTTPLQTAQVQGYTLSPAQEAQAISYAHARHELYFFDVAYGLLVLVLLLQLRVAPFFRDIAERETETTFWRIVVFVALLLLTIDVLSLPTAIWGHVLALKYQQSIQGWNSWLIDWAKGEGIEITIGVILVWVLYWTIRKSPRRWWLYFWFATVPLIILGAVIEPVIVEPLFFRFRPVDVTQPQLAQRIEQMTVHAGVHIPQDRILEMNASVKLKELNAYVSGLSGSLRMVIWDTTIHRMDEDEVLFVSGHEMGHYVLGHVRDGILFSLAVLFFFLYLAFRLLNWMLVRWGETWAIHGADDMASLPALILLLSIFGFLFTPISNAYSRQLEHQADQYGLEVIHGLVPDAPVVAAHAFQVLGEVDLEEPNPSTAVKFWFYNHPPLDERMRFAQTYNPWSEGHAPEFVK